MDKVQLYRRFAWPLLERLTRPNAAHEQVLFLAGAFQRTAPGLRLFERLAAQGGRRYQSARLRMTVGGVALENPLMLAAGFDKDARALEALYRLGFGSVVVGTVLRDPQPGNPLPTIFRPARGAFLNRMGFPSRGMDHVAANLGRCRPLPYPTGISVGLNKVLGPDDAPEAYAAVVGRLYAHAAYFEINVSSPNTPGLRRLQDKAHLVAIIQAIREKMEQAGGARPLFVKVSPDLTLPALDELIQTVIDQRLSGIIATNTTTDLAIKAALGPRWANEAGGVSGAPLRELSTSRVRHIYRQTGGVVEVIGSGGVADLDSALEKLFAGAKALQIYSGLVSHGPALPTHLNRALDCWLEEQGVSSIEEIIGHDA